MSTDPIATSHTVAVSRSYDPVAAILSYLVPGLGQIYQGRTAKGVLFMVCLLGMFFYGMWLGSWSNVYIPRIDESRPGVFNKIFTNFLGQNRQKVNCLVAVGDERMAFAGQFWIGAAAWPALWQYARELPPSDGDDKPPTFAESFERTPSERYLNELQANGDKTWDLAWVYTVIAGVLNILVIYDALAGPAFQQQEPEKDKDKEEDTKSADQPEAVVA